MDAPAKRRVAVNAAGTCATAILLTFCIASDAWFGDSAAPRQHLALSVFRAIETRRDLVRVTNTGVSTLIDATGRIQWQGPLHEVDADNPLPPETFIVEAALLDIKTPFLPFHRYFPWACGLAVVVISLANARKQWQHGKRGPHGR